MKPSLFRKILIIALALSAAGITAAAESLLEPGALRGKKVLLVTGEPDKEHPSDDPLVKEHLEAMGLVVTVTQDDKPAPANGQDLVVISATADAHALGEAYRETPVPVLTWNAYGYQYLAMTGDMVHRDFEVIDTKLFSARTFSALYPYCVDANHPIARAAGLPCQMFGTYYLKSTDSCWGRPSLGARVLAVYEGNPDRAAIFTYEKGSTMVGNYTAPGRRAGFYLGRDNFHILSEIHGPWENDPDQRTWWVGKKLFDATVRWALAPPPAPPAHDPAALRAALKRTGQGQKLLYVCRLPTEEGQEADEHIVEHLRSLGLDVTVRDGEQPEDNAAGFNLVIISSTCSKYKLTNKYRNVSIPLIYFESLSSDSFRATGRNRYTDYGMHGEEGESDDPPENYLRIISAEHPLAAGLSAGMHRFLKEPELMKWAKPTRSAVVIATVGNSPDQAVIFGYEKGAMLADDSLAPARRMMFGLDNPQFDDLTDDGLLLFDASILWCISKPE